MQTSFFKVDRSLLNSNRWLAEPFSRGQAWVDIFGLAQHCDSFIRVRGFRIEIKRGQLARSLETLSARWKWSKNKVIRYLKELENDGDIGMQKNNKITLITVKKYDLWQKNGYAERNDNGTTDETANLTAEGYTERPQKGIQKDRRRVTYKNVENVKNDKNVKNPVDPTGLLPTPGVGTEEIVFPDLVSDIVEGQLVEPPAPLVKKGKRPDKVEGVNDVIDIFHKLNPVINYSNAAYRTAATEIIKRVGSEDAVAYAQMAIEVQGQMFAPVITNPLQLRDKLGELIGFKAKGPRGKKLIKIE